MTTPSAQPPERQTLEADLRWLFAEKLKPETDLVDARRRQAKLRGLLVAAGLFVVAAGGMMLAVRPYADAFSLHGTSIWPFCILLPLTLAILAFTAFHLFALRSAVNAFRAAVAERVAEFVDPGTVFEAGGCVAAETLARSFLFSDASRVGIGTGRFRGGIGGARYEIGEIILDRPAPTGAKAGDKAEGVFFAADFPKRFCAFSLILPGDEPVDLPALDAAMAKDGLKPGAAGELKRLSTEDAGWQIVIHTGEKGNPGGVLPVSAAARLDEARRHYDFRIGLSRAGSRLSLAVIAPESRKGGDFGFLDTLDFDRCIAFCRSARLCLELVRALEGDAGEWEE